MTGAGQGRRWMARLGWRLAVVAWLAGCVVTWNVVFDAHVRAGAREYVERQQLYVEGRGPRADMDAVMHAAVTAGLRDATLWSMIFVVPAAACATWRMRQKRRPSQPVISG